MLATDASGTETSSNLLQMAQLVSGSARHGTVPTSYGGFEV